MFPKEKNKLHNIQKGKTRSIAISMMQYMHLLPTLCQSQSPAHNKRQMQRTHDRQRSFVLTSDNKIMMDMCEEYTTDEIGKSPLHPQTMH